MQIQDLKPAKKRKKGHRVGRGGKRGIYSGRGNKGQKARTNKRMKLKRIGSSLSRHLPKLGGFVSKHPKAQVVRIDALEKKFGSGDRINPAVLAAKRIIRSAILPVKILGSARIAKKFTVEKCMVSVAAKEQIIKAGGAVK